MTKLLKFVFRLAVDGGKMKIKYRDLIYELTALIYCYADSESMMTSVLPNEP